MTLAISPVPAGYDAGTSALMFARGLANATVSEGGATLDASSGRPAGWTTGYMVGGAVPSLTLPATLAPVHVATLADWLASVRPGAIAARQYVGSWIDGATAWFDVSDRLADRADALTLAAARGELAIWDLANAAEIRVTPATV